MDPLGKSIMKKTLSYAKRVKRKELKNLISIFIEIIFSIYIYILYKKYRQAGVTIIFAVENNR